MSGGGAHGGMMSSTSRRLMIPRMPLMNGRKERDHEDLILFQELHKREKERNVVSLLQPVSDEFEPTGNYQLYRIASAKKGSGFEFLADQNDKNDYDWLKTPPATPLFPSLEMDTNNPELVLQREMPLFQPLSRFAGGNCKPEETVAARNESPKSPKPKPKVCPDGGRSRMMRCVTPTPSTSSDQKRISCKTVSVSVSASPTVVHTKNRSTSSEAIHDHLSGQKGVRLMGSKTAAADSNDVVQIRPKRSAAANLNNNNNNVLVPAANKSSTSANIHVDRKEISSSTAVGGVQLTGNESKSKPTSTPTRDRRTSADHLINARSRSTTEIIVAGFRNEKAVLPNLRTEKRPTSASATRGRSPAPGSASKAAAIFQSGPCAGGGGAGGALVITRRQSCSPSASRGRKVVVVAEQAKLSQVQQQQLDHDQTHSTMTVGLKGRLRTGDETQVLGSRMVQRVMNARKAAMHNHHHAHEDKGHKKPTTHSRGF